MKVRYMPPDKPETKWIQNHFVMLMQVLMTKHLENTYLITSNLHFSRMAETQFGSCMKEWEQNGGYGNFVETKDSWLEANKTESMTSKYFKGETTATSPEVGCSPVC